MGVPVRDCHSRVEGVAVKIKKTAIDGVYEVWPELMRDDRGFFARTSCVDEFAALALPADWEQCSVSWNERRFTLRGMHYQNAPHGEQKLVRCTRGSVFDVAVDLRPESATYLRWHGTTLSWENRAGLYISAGIAHGFLSLEDGSEVFYQIRGRHVPQAARGVRWNDPAFGIAWPGTPAVISERDAGYPDWNG